MIITRMSEHFKHIDFIFFKQQIFLWYNHPIDLNFGILIPKTTKYNLLAKHIYIEYIPAVFNKLTYNLITTFIFWLFSVIQVLMFASPIVSELHFFVATTILFSFQACIMFWLIYLFKNLSFLCAVFNFIVLSVEEI